MTVGFVPQSVDLVSRDKMSMAWYRYFQQLHQWSGLDGANFPLYSAAVVAAGAMTLDVGSPPTPAAFKGNIAAPSFADGASNRVHFGIVIPYGYLEGAELVPVIRWSPATAATGTVIWNFEYSSAAVDSAFAAEAVVTCTDDAAGTAHGYQVVEGDSISGLEPGALLMVSVSRDGAADTYADAAFLLSAGVTFTNTALGSQARF